MYRILWHKSNIDEFIFKTLKHIRYYIEDIFLIKHSLFHNITLHFIKLPSYKILFDIYHMNDYLLRYTKPFRNFNVFSCDIHEDLNYKNAIKFFKFHYDNYFQSNLLNIYKKGYLHTSSLNQINHEELNEKYLLILNSLKDHIEHSLEIWSKNKEFCFKFFMDINYYIESLYLKLYHLQNSKFFFSTEIYFVKDNEYESSNYISQYKIDNSYDSYSRESFKTMNYYGTNTIKPNYPIFLKS